MSRRTSPSVQLAVALIIAHATVVAAHGAAHQILGVGVSPSQTLFIVLFILTAPILAGILFWKGSDIPASIILTISMTGAFLFGVYYHFVKSSSDHVSHVSTMSPKEWANIFQATAILLALTEGMGICLGIWILKRNRQAGIGEAK
jgi:hypothetical protein